MKNLKKIVFGLLAMLVMVTSVSAEDLTAMPTPDENGVIKLESNVNLSQTYVIESYVTITIDLNGHTITGPTSGYAINNKGTLTIQDTAETKGLITCTTEENQNSCIRNAKKLVVDGAKVNSAKFVALKNESTGTMTVRNQSVISSGVDNSTIKGNTATIFNLGDLTIDNSKVESTGSQGVAVMSLDYPGPEEGEGNATATITNSTITATGSKSVAINSTNGGEMKVENSTVDSVAASGNGSAIIKDSTINGSVAGPDKDVALEGDIKTKYVAVVKYAKENSKIELTANDSINNDTTVVPEGVTLVIPKGISLSLDHKKVFGLMKNGTLTVNGTIEGELGAVAYNEETGTYYATLERAIEDAKDGETITVLKESEETYDYLTLDENFKPVGNNNDAIEILAKNVTLNLNGHKVDANILVNAEKSMTIVDEAGRGEYNGSLTNNGELTLASGYFAKLPVTGENATTNLVGGTFPANQVSEDLLPEGKELSKNTDGTVSIVDSKTNEPADTPQDKPTGEGDGNEETESTTEVKVEETEGTKEVTLSTEANDVLRDSLAKTEDKELQEFLANNNVTVHLESNKVARENVAKDVVAKFESVIKGATVAEYFDLDILVTAEGQDVHYLKELSKPITLTVDLPKLPEVAKGYTRTYYILREHDGKVEKLDATLTEDGKLSFATDKFSKYAIAYEDVKNPGTLDSIVSIVTLAISSLGTAGYSIKKFIRK